MLKSYVFFLVRYNYDRSIKKYGDVDRLLCLFVLCVCLIGRLKKIWNGYVYVS